MMLACMAMDTNLYAQQATDAATAGTTQQVFAHQKFHDFDITRGHPLFIQDSNHHLCAAFRVATGGLAFADVV